MSLNGTNDIHFIDETEPTNIFNNNSIDNNFNQHERSLSSDETIFLSLPNKSTSDPRLAATIHNNCSESDLISCKFSNLNMSTPLLTSRAQNHPNDSSTNTSSTTTPDNNIRYCPTANDSYQSILSEWSSSDEHTSFYNDKVSRVSSIPIESTSNFYTPSGSCNGAYLFPSISYIFSDIFQLNMSLTAVCCIHLISIINLARFINHHSFSNQHKALIMFSNRFRITY